MSLYLISIVTRQKTKEYTIVLVLLLLQFLS